MSGWRVSRSRRVAGVASAGVSLRAAPVGQRRGSLPRQFPVETGAGSSPPSQRSVSEMKAQRCQSRNVTPTGTTTTTKKVIYGL